MKSRFLLILVVLVILASIVPLSVGAAGGKVRFDWVVTKRLTVKNASEFLDALDLNGNDLIIDADGDSILDEGTDDAIRMTLGAASGTFSVLTGNLKVGNGTPGVTQNGEDAYIEGTLEVDGAVRFDGALDVRGNVSDGAGVLTFADANGLMVDGQADVGQFTIQGHTTQSVYPNLFVVEQHDGADKFTVSNTGNVAVGGTFASTGAATFSGAVTVAQGQVVTIDVGTEHFGLPSIVTATVVYTSSGAVFTIADGEIWFVHQVFYEVTTNFDCTGNDCTLDLGDGSDADGLLNCADADIQTTYTDYTGAAAGWGALDGSAPKGVYLVGGEHIYAPSGADETIDIVIGGTAPAAGVAVIYIVYTRID